MTDQHCSELSSNLVAVRLELICKVQGLEQAEKFFNNIPKQLKGMEAFGSLLYCYVHVKSVENAEGLFKKMKDLGYANSLSYNTLMNLYLQTKQYEKLDSVVKEMNENGISCNKFTYGMLMTKFVATSDIDQMKATLKRLEDDPKVIAAWEVYSIAADCYKKVGILDKAVKMLKKSEVVVPLKQQRVACDLLLSRYSGMGLKDDVYGLWNLQKSISKKVSNASYICMLASLSNLDDIEGAEKVLEEWESKCFCYDFQVPNQLVAAYCKKGQFDKVVSFIKRAIEGGRMSYPSTWEYLATGYINSNQIPKGLEMMKKAISNNVAACLADLSRKDDVEGAEEFSSIAGKSVSDAHSIGWKSMVFDVEETDDTEKKGADIPTYVVGVNEGDYSHDVSVIVSNASCTTNCLDPFVKVMDEEFGIVKGTMTTTHSYTGDQRLLDASHRDLRRARAAALNIVPTSTGAAKAVSLVLPQLKGKLNGIALRVDLVVNVEKKGITAEDVNAAFRKSANGPLNGILAICDVPLVPVDFRCSDVSSTIDSSLTMVMGDDMVKVVAWYDNEWGYSQRVVDLAHLVASKWPGAAVSGSGDPLEDYCKEDPATKECKVYEA
ncbi:hypothetical protein ACLOJK_012779 [Asimina triloba]